MEVGQPPRVAGASSKSAPGTPWSLVACIAATFFLRCGSFAAGVLLGLHLAYISANVAPVGGVVVGLLAAAFFSVELVGAPIVGILGDRFGHRPFLLAGPIAGGIAAQALGLTTLIPLLFVAMAIKGLSSATSVPATLTYLSYGTRYDEAMRTRAVAWFEVATVAGIGLGGFLGGMFWAWLGPWAFTGVASLYVIAFLLFLTMGPADLPPGSTRRRKAGDYLPLFRKPRLVRFIPAWVAVNAVVGLWIQHAPYILAQTSNPNQLLQGGQGGSTVGLVFAGVGLLFMTGITVWGSLLAGQPRTIGMYVGVGGLATLTILLAILNHSGSSWGGPQAILLSFGAAALFLTAAFTPAALAHLADIAEEQGNDRGAVMGLYSVFFGIGQVSGALLGGPLGQAFGADGLILLTGILVIVVFFSVRLLRGERAPTLKSRSRAA